MTSCSVRFLTCSHADERSRLLTVVASAATPSGVDQIIKFLDEKNLKVNHVVSSLGQTIGQPVSEWNEVCKLSRSRKNL